MIPELAVCRISDTLPCARAEVTEVLDWTTLRLERRVMESMTVQELFDLTGQVALITGGARNLGFDIAVALAQATPKAEAAIAAEDFLGAMAAL